jgi:CHAT domain-containing protein/Tfp pilus assembly protein PilF
MTDRFVWALVLLLVFPLFAPTAGAIPQTQSPAVNTEPLGPKPSGAVEKLLAEATRLADTKQSSDSLKVAEQSLDTARQSGDRPGEALAQEARAKALQSLQRSDESMAAWQEAADIWGANKDTPERITPLVQAGLLRLSADKNQAEKDFAQALSIGKSETQRPSAAAQALQDSGLALSKQLQQQIALDFLGVALAVREKQTPNSLPLVETLNAFAYVANERAERTYDEQYFKLAKGYSARAVELAQRLAPDSAILVTSLSILAHAEAGLSSNRNAIEHFQAALEIDGKLAPGGSVEEIRILNQLSKTERLQGNFSTAHQHASEAVAMGERIAPESVEMINSLDGLGVIEWREGYLAEAREHLQHSLAMKEKLGGLIGPTYINVGLVVLDQGDFAMAEGYFQKALDLFLKDSRKVYGVKVALTNLSHAAYDQGDITAAVEYARRAIALSDPSWLDDPESCDVLELMGDLLREQGKFNEASDYYRRVMEIRQRLAPDSLYVSETLQAFGELARAQNNPNLALDYDRRALEMAQKTCPDSSCAASLLVHLGQIAYEQGDLVASENYLRRAVAVQERSLGPQHPDLARSLNDLARTLAARGNKADALVDALRAEKIGAAHLRLSVRTLSERQALAYERVRASGLDLALSLALDPASTSSDRRQVFDAVIQSRALVFDELASRRHTVYSNSNHDVAQTAEQLFAARARLATLAVRGAGSLKPETYRRLLDEARTNEEQAERMLAEKSNAFRQDQARNQIGLKEVAASLPQGGALVAFVRYVRYDFKRSSIGKPAAKAIPSYAAIVLCAGQREPEFVQLGRAQAIESLLAAWRQNISQQAEIAGTRDHADEDTYRRLGAALRRKIWDPLTSQLGSSQEVFVVPDAMLHLINLASLPVGSSRYLIEAGPQNYYLSTERDLVPTQNRHGDGILVVGNPTFDQTGNGFVVINKQSPEDGGGTDRSGGLLRGSRSSCRDFESLRFTPLPASQREVEDIAALWKRSTSGVSTYGRTLAAYPGNGQMLQLTGADASPEAFEQYAPGRRVLHVATHGFFLQNSCSLPLHGQSDSDRSDAQQDAENPLLLSGLALAGADRRVTAKSDETDGILTAEEIAGMNLEGVDWAVLSACDTALGEVRIGEGVFGLRRAFQVAGAKTVIMSLWQVEDETTRQWMTILYRQHFMDGKGTGQSVRTANLQMLWRRRAKQLSTHPFYWAAFIAVGDWR